MKKPLLSIVVPTKNRYQYLKCLIQLIKELGSDEVEMVIQDNSDDNKDFLKYMEEKSYHFIRYDYVKEQIPMSENSDKGILNSTGEYICFIGDDDGVTKHIIGCVQWMKENDIEALKPAAPNYCWPDAPQGRSADICYYPFSGNIRMAVPYEELIKVLKDGIQSRGEMPLAYHSIVRRDVMDIVYKQCGTYFPGNSPDISNAVALSLVVKKYAIVDVPIAYSGSSAFKGGGVFARGNADPAINEVPWFRPQAEERWNKILPRIAAGNIIWADSALEALHLMQRDDLQKKFNKYKCYTSLMLSKPQLTKYVKEVCDNHFHLYSSYIWNFFCKIIRSSILRIGWKFGFKQKPLYVRNINNIIDASKVLEDLSGNNIFPQRKQQ